MPIHPNTQLPGALDPHVRQRMAFIAAMIPDPDSANWPAISDTFDDLSQDTQRTALEPSIESLRDPIRRRDARALIAAIGALLSDGADAAKATSR